MTSPYEVQTMKNVKDDQPEFSGEIPELISTLQDIDYQIEKLLEQRWRLNGQIEKRFSKEGKRFNETAEKFQAVMNQPVPAPSQF